MQKHFIAAFGSCITMLLSINVCAPAAAKEPAELRTIEVTMKVTRLTEAAAQIAYAAMQKEYQPTEDVAKQLSAGKLKYSQLFSAMSIDLNNDNVPELMVTADPEKVDLPMHNPPIWILAKVNGKYKQILDADGGISVLATRTAGYADLCNAQHASAAETELAIFKFSRGRYRVAKCYTQTYLRPDGSARKSPVFVKHSCGSEYR